MKSIVLVVLLLVPVIASAQTEVSGDQSGTWTSADSPYLVTGEIVVPTGQTLSIGPGVEINFQGHYKFTVNGNLQAVGNGNDMIFFTTDNPSVGWGGIRIDSNLISTLTFCRVEFGRTSGSYPDIHGGGLALLGADAVVSNCVFADNDATGNELGMGGAVYAIGTGSPTEPLTRFIDCTFLRNHAYGEGGAIKFSGDMNTEISGCTFIQNDCGYGGGAISCYLVTNTKMINCLFTDNYTMYAKGGAVNTLGMGNTIFLVGCTLSGNTAVTGEGGAVNLAYGTGYFVNTIVYDNPGMYADDVYLDWGGSAEVHFCNMPFPDGATGGNNIDENPMFVNASAGEYQLAEGSPCINMGTAFMVLGGETILDLSPSQYCGMAPDMGAYEYCAATDVPGTGATSLTTSVYPNPFNPRTRIDYDLPHRGELTIQIFDVHGKRVASLIEDIVEAGPGSVFWDGTDNRNRAIAAGVYFCSVRSLEHVRVHKITLLK